MLLIEIESTVKVSDIELYITLRIFSSQATLFYREHDNEYDNNWIMKLGKESHGYEINNETK